MIALLAIQSCAQTFIPNAIMLIDTTDNASYNQVHWLIRMPYLSIKASNEFELDNKEATVSCMCTEPLTHLTM